MNKKPETMAEYSKRLNAFAEKMHATGTAAARRDRARARKYESERLRGQPHPYPLGVSPWVVKP